MTSTTPDAALAVGARGALPAAVPALLRALVSPRAWTATVHVVLGLPLPLLVVPPLLVLLAVSTGLLLAALVGLLGYLLALRVGSGAAGWERWRTAQLLGRTVPAPVLEPANGPKVLVRDLRSGARWRALLLTLLSLPLSLVSAFLVVGAWSGGLALTALPLYGWLLPDEARAGSAAALVAGTLAGVVVLLAAPWLAVGAAAVHVRLLELLGGDRTPLEERVRHLEASRSGVVDAADAERRRIERDLHDGAQPRLVAVAMTLGRARAKLAADPAATGEVQALLDDAHEEAKLALAELRDLARGIAPSVLTDRGLDAALPPLVARSPVPVDLQVRVDPRPPRPVEAAAYFVVSEAVTNAVKHSGATRIAVRVDGDRDRLSVEVVDDGRGGAELREGGGLLGLQRRVAAGEGRLDVLSTAAGTTVRAVLPCAS